MASDTTSLETIEAPKKTIESLGKLRIHGDFDIHKIKARRLTIQENSSIQVNKLIIKDEVKMEKGTELRVNGDMGVMSGQDDLPTLIISDKSFLHIAGKGEFVAQINSGCTIETWAGEGAENDS